MLIFRDWGILYLGTEGVVLSTETRLLRLSAGQWYAGGKLECCIWRTITAYDEQVPEDFLHDVSIVIAACEACQTFAWCVCLSVLVSLLISCQTALHRQSLFASPEFNPFALLHTGNVLLLSLSVWIAIADRVTDSDGETCPPGVWTAGRVFWAFGATLRFGLRHERFVWLKPVFGLFAHLCARDVWSLRTILAVFWCFD